MPAPTDWLLEGPAWVQYRTRLDLLEQPRTDPSVQHARQQMLADPLVQGLLEELSNWPGEVLASHKSASQSFHKLAFIADLGLEAGDPGMQPILERVLAHQSAEGPFQLPTKIGPQYGGTGEEIWAWALCDAPLIVYALTKFGLGDDPRLKQATEYLAGLVCDNGWPCVVAPELKFRGPGRKGDPCPFANLAMLKALSAADDWCDSPASRTGAETLLRLWSESLTQHPYIFYMGTDFRKLKVPFIWYDLVHVLEVLTRFEWLREDPRLCDMLALMISKADAQGCFTLESVWTAWKGWEFGQKKEPSRWLTLAAWRIIRRMKNTL